MAKQERLPAAMVNGWKPTLPALPYDAWEQTRKTLHLLCQIVGKVRLAATPRQNHWWHVPLYMSPRGLTTGTVYAPNDPLLTLDVEIDLLEPCGGGVRVRNNRGGVWEADVLSDGRSCASMYRGLLSALSAAGLDVTILDRPYELAWAEKRFGEDEEARGFDPAWAARYFRALSWVERTFQEFRGEFWGSRRPRICFGTVLIWR